MPVKAHLTYLGMKALEGVIFVVQNFFPGTCRIGVEPFVE